MRIIVAEALGMCFGVRDALLATEGVERPTEVTIHGELVHNPEVLERLAGQGVRDDAGALSERDCRDAGGADYGAWDIGSGAGEAGAGGEGTD